MPITAVIKLFISSFTKWDIVGGVYFLGVLYRKLYKLFIHEFLKHAGMYWKYSSDYAIMI